MLNVIEDMFMVNQIHDTGNFKPIETDSRLKEKQQPNINPEQDHPNESVSISDTSKQLEALKAMLKDVSEINEARIQFFKSEIQSGNYKINSGKIAEKMLNNLEMA